MEGLVASLVFKYGPLSTREIEQLVACHNQTGKYGNSETIYSNVGQVANRLFNELHLIAFSSITGLWYKIFDEKFHEEKLNSKVEVNRDIYYPEPTDPKDLYFKQYGVGSEYVYVVYSTDLRIESIVNRRRYFPLKVGKTNNIARRIAQLSEAGPSPLTIGTLFRTDEASRLERFIHKKLRYQGQNLDIPGRKEWFLSNLSQVTDCYHHFQQEGRWSHGGV